MFGRKDSKTATPDGTTKPRAVPASPARPLPAAATGASAAGSAAGSKGKLAYEARRAAKAGVALEKWMADKTRRVQAEREAVQRARKKAAPDKPSLLRRLLDRAHRPL